MFRVRRAEGSDLKSILDYNQNRQDKNGGEELFHHVHLPSLVENSFLSLTAVDEQDDVIGFIAFDHSPPSGSCELDSDQFLQFLQESFILPTEFKIQNTIWLSYLSCKADLNCKLLQQFIDMLYASCPQLENLILLAPPNAMETLGKIHSIFEPLEKNELHETTSHPDLVDHYVLSASRSKMSHYVQPLNVRSARMEDHDDLLPVLELQSESLSANFGEFYVAQLIESEDERNKSLVAHVDDKAIGLLCLSDEFELRDLQLSFELDVYGNLAKTITPRLDAQQSEQRRLEILRSARKRLTPNVMVLGPRSSGKTTQAKALAETWDLIYLSKDEMVQTAAETGTTVGREAETYLKAGEIVPDETIIDIILERLQQLDCVSKGWILDGFPMTQDQASAMRTVGIIPDIIVTLGIDSETLKERSAEQEEPEKLYDDISLLTPLWSDTADVLIEHFDGANEAEKLMLSIRTCIEKRIHGTEKGLDRMMTLVEQEFRFKEEQQRLEEAQEQDTNAFVISLFCIDEKYESRSADFLTKAFEAFPEKEYCLLTLPPSAQEPPLLKDFTIIPASPDGSFSHVLYLLHRDTLLMHTEFAVSRYISSDHFTQVRNLLQSVRSRDEIEQTIDQANEDAYVDLEDNPASIAFVATVAEKVVGIATLTRSYTQQDGTAELRMQYDLDGLVPSNIHRARSLCTMTCFMMNPLFFSAFRYFLAEIMRQYHKSCIFYRLPPQDHVIPCLQELIQAKPRRLPASNPPVAQENSFALFFITKRLLVEPKLVVNKRVVVIGASDTAIQCIRDLLLVPYLYLTNIALISPNGIPKPRHTASIAQDMLPRHSTEYTAIELDQISLSSRVRVIESRVVDLDREGQTVVFPDHSFVCFDILILATGLQNGDATKLGYAPEFNDEKRYKPADLPKGMFCISDNTSAVLAHDAIVELNHRNPTGIVVYGERLHALTILSGLLRRQIPGNLITWVSAEENKFDATGEEDALPVHDETIAQRVVAKILSFGIRIKRNLTLHAVQLDEKTNSCVRGVEFESSNGTKEMIQCELFLCGDQNAVDPDIFRAINESGLVFDGRLIVNADLQTTDPSIFSTGGLARFSRRYKDVLFHQYYNSREMGSHLAQSVLRAIDPLAEQENPPQELPTFDQPTAISAVLPGDIHYTGIILPGISIPCCSTLPTTITSDATEEGELIHHSSIFINTLGKVCAMAYLGNEAVEVQNLQCLVGLHESYLNSAVASYENHLVDDWIAFFRQGWACALYHDKFRDFCSSLQQLLAKDDGIHKVMSAGTDCFKDTKDESKVFSLLHKTVGRGGCLLLPSTKSMIESHLMEFLSSNRNILTMYHHEK